MKQDDMVSDDDMASGSMDHVDRDDDCRLILLTAKCVDTYIEGGGGETYFMNY